MFPGFEELDTFVKDVNAPTLQAFAADKAEQIAKWTLDQSCYTDIDIFNLWHKRFIKSLVICRPELPINSVVTILATENAKRKLVASSGSSSSRSRNNNNNNNNSNNNSSYQGVIHISVDDEEDSNMNAHTIKEIIYWCGVEKVSGVEWTDIQEPNVQAKSSCILPLN
ncbi:hypothetical protein INT47_010005 [Mucor saturninus]|uniref:Uncharacterized protein n=1 Tax=Mucor saturninus TaxID=64648 RepID=A0A8H7QLI7_9FUNG|nr:hypothetical protein INT47_010005 [Mucor saturninus]